MGGLAPGKLKSRRGWPSSPRRLLHRSNFLDPGFKNSLQEKLYQRCGAGDILIAIDSRRLGPSWSAKMAHSFTAADILGRYSVCSRDSFAIGRKLLKIKRETGIEPATSSLGIWAYFVNKEH